MSKRSSLSNRLDEYAGQSVPDDTDLWPAILAGVAKREARGPSGKQNAKRKALFMVGPLSRASVWAHHVSRFTFHVRSLPSLAMLLVVGLVVLGLAWGRVQGLPDRANTGALPSSTPAWSVSVPVDTTPQPYTEHLGHMGLSHVERLGTRLHTGITVGGYTVTLLMAYADANHTVVIYSLEGPGSDRVAPTGNKLQVRGPHPGARGGPELAGLVASCASYNPQTYVLAFDSSLLTGVNGMPSTLELTLTFDLAATGPGAQNPPLLSGIPPEGSSWTVLGMEMMSRTGEEAGASTTAAGPFKFEFSVPVHTEGTRVVDVDRSITAGGKAVTLQRVVITEGEMRATLRYKMPEGTGDGDPWTPVFELRAPGFESSSIGETHIPMLMRKTGEDSWSYSIFAPLTGRGGAWSFTLSELRLRPPESDGSSSAPYDRGSEHKAGPWTFEFDVPK